MDDIEQPLTVRVCLRLKERPSKVHELIKLFGTTRARMRGTIDNLRKAGCVRPAEGVAHHDKTYHFVTMPKTRRPSARKPKPGVPPSTGPRRYVPEFRPLQGRDQFAHWRLREDDPEHSCAAVHSCRI